MGFFSKVWKGVKKGFKKIGKGIKKGFKAFGKFMGKIGILGTIALTLLTGGLGIGAAFSGFGASLGAAGASMGGAMGGILKAASWTIGKAAQFGSTIKSGFQTVTKGVTEFFGQAGKLIGNKLGITTTGPTSVSQAWGNYSSAMTDQFNTFKGDALNLFSTTSPTLEAGKLGMNMEEYNKFSTQTPTMMEEVKYGKDFVPNQSPAAQTDYLGVKVDQGPTSLPDGTTTVGTGGLKEISTEVASIETPSLLSRGVTSAKDNLFEGVTKAPGAMLTTAITNKAMGTGDVDPYYNITPVAQFDSSYGIAGAVQQGFTPTEDPLWSQQLFDYDAYATNQGGYGNVYANRMRGAMT